MSYQDIVIGAANGGTGDTPFAAWTKAKTNFSDLNRFNVEKYGAIADLQTVLDGVMNSGSPNLACASNPFVAGDVGKRIAVSRAGAANAPLRGTILTFTDAGHVVLSVNAGANVTAQMVDWGTDSTPAIINATVAAFALHGGNVFFPLGTTGGYMIDGDLQTSVSGTNPNAQIYIPSNVDSTLYMGTIRFVGEISFTLPTLRLGVQKSGVYLKSTRLGSGSNPSFFGSIGTTGNYLDYNYCDVRMENLAVLVYTNNGSAAPSMHGIDYRHIATAMLKNVAVGLDVPFNSSFDPSSAEFAGIIVGGRDNDGPNYIETCSVTGFKYNYVLGEHTTVNNPYSFAGLHAYVIPRQNYLVVGHMLSHYCKNVFLFPGAQIMGLDHDDAKFSRVNLTVEMENSTTGLWYDSGGLTFISDVDNIAFGEIKYMFLSGGAIRNDLIINTVTGGANLDLIPTDGFMTLAATIGSNTNNYAPTNIGIANKLILTASSAFDLTGIAGVRMTNGREMTIRNASATNTITIKNDVTSTAANRFLMNADFALLPNMTAKFEYDSTASRWIKLS